ncbi:MAG: Co2+/Mg2+ efflux protein ApaG [Deltaproteobacteria bacterium]|nr:Co2+/Mg2+ efflux protein ApaG [Deltaproteobacteria bacterium]
MFSSEAVTNQIRIRVESIFVPERSDPDQNYWFFAYRVEIHNEGTEAAQLISRHWIITDANGHVEHVKGPGVVGEQPVLQPGETFEYTSACPLRTPVGTMQGTYQMVTSSGESFDAEIAPFSLGEPRIIN